MHYSWIKNWWVNDLQVYSQNFPNPNQQGGQTSGEEEGEEKEGEEKQEEEKNRRRRNAICHELLAICHELLGVLLASGYMTHIMGRGCGR